VVGPGRTRALGRRSGHGEHRQQVADGQCDDHRRREAATAPPPEAAQADLHRPRQEARPAEQPVARVLATDRRSGRLERVPEIDADAAPDRRERSEHRHEHAEGDARDHHRRVDGEPDVDRPEHRAEVARKQVGEEDAEDDANHGAEHSEQEGGPQIDERDLPPARADRAHDPDLARLLCDERGHRVRDEDERREQRQQRDHAEELGERLGIRLPRPVAGSTKLREAPEAGEARHGLEVAAHAFHRLRAAARIAQAYGEAVVPALAAERGDRVRGRVEDDQILVLDLLAARDVAPFAGDPQATRSDDPRRVAGVAAVDADVCVLDLGQHLARAGIRARGETDDIDALAREVANADHERGRAPLTHEHACVDSDPRLDGRHVRKRPERCELLVRERERPHGHRRVRELFGPHFVLHRGVDHRRDGEEGDARDRERERRDREPRPRPTAGEISDRLAYRRGEHLRLLSPRRRRRRGS